MKKSSPWISPKAGILMKAGKNRVSKEDTSSKRMFGSKRGSHGKDLLIGKRFGGKHSSGKAMRASDISPSVDEFNNMLAEAGGIKKKKKTFFSKD